MAKEYDLKAFEAAKASLFKDTESLPSLACRRRCVRSSLREPTSELLVWAVMKDTFRRDELTISNPMFYYRRFIDAMLIQREFKAGQTEFAKRVAPEDQGRLVRDRLYLLKQCVISGKDADAGKEPYLYNLH